MWGDDLSPGLQCGCGRRFDQRAADLALLAAYLFIEDQAAQVHLHTANLVGLRGGNGRQEACGRIERPVGVVTRKGVLMSPSVSHVTKLRHQRALGLPKRLPED